MELLVKHRDQIIQLCQEYKVKNLYVFGSILSDKFNNQSDIDLVVEFLPIDPLAYMENYFNFKFGLIDLLQKEIDLLEAQAIRNPIFLESIEQTKRLIYDNGSKELAA